jgi:hypothetical protein
MSSFNLTSKLSYVSTNLVFNNFNDSSAIGVSCDLVTVATSSLLDRCFVSCGVLFLVAFIVVCIFAYAWCLL